MKILLLSQFIYSTIGGVGWGGTSGRWRNRVREFDVTIIIDRIESMSVGAVAHTKAS